MNMWTWDINAKYVTVVKIHHVQHSKQPVHIYIFIKNNNNKICIILICFSAVSVWRQQWRGRRFRRHWEYVSKNLSLKYIWINHVILAKVRYAPFSVDFLRSLFSRTLGLSPGEKVLDELTLDGVARYILSGKCELTSQMSPVFKSKVCHFFNVKILYYIQVSMYSQLEKSHL